jgi:hypothetical protein
LLNETESEPPWVFDRYIDRVTDEIVALLGIEVKSNAINPRRKLGAPVLPAKR